MAKAGYFGGDPEAVKNAPVDAVEAIINYEDFSIAYEREYLALNKEG